MFRRGLNLNKLFRIKFKSPDDAWCVITALRGPDFTPSTELKYLFTVFIRRVVLKNYETPPEIPTRDKVDLVLREVEYVAKSERANFSHWAFHISEALAVIGRSTDGVVSELAKLLRKLIDKLDNYAYNVFRGVKETPLLRKEIDEIASKICRLYGVEYGDNYLEAMRKVDYGKIFEGK